MGRIKHQHKLEDIGFQIAPMIDVVFVIMLFFMVKVGSRQTETEIKSKLPSVVETSGPVTGLDSLEETVEIDENGVLSHNQEILEQGGSSNADLAELKQRMKRLAEQGRADKTAVIVTINTQPDTKYSRVVDVMNALQYAGLRNVTFAAGEAF